MMNCLTERTKVPSSLLNDNEREKGRNNSKRTDNCNMADSFIHGLFSLLKI